MKQNPSSVQILQIGKKTGRKSPLFYMLRSWQLYVLLAPTILYLFIFNYVPMYGIQIAFRDFVANKGITGSPWVGMKHFQYFFSSPQFSSLLVNTVKLSLFSLLWNFPFPILLALMLNEVSHIGYKKFVQNVTYMPYFISTVVLVSMLNLFLAQQDGMINQVIGALGGTKIDFLGKAAYFRTVYIASGIWQGTGWSSIIYLAALSGVDTQLHEAAQIDGASRIQRVWHINVPCILPTATILFIMSCGQIMNVGYEKVYLMQNSLNMEVSEVISTYVYKTGLLNVKYSYTTAIGLFNNVINVVVLLLVNGISQKLSETSLF
ncbi:MAG: sugar ABC transporter permease [Oscillospiraceae bacterium]|jgi:putative aldouronate transport system permease protein|nr:sugar ABC transporter permease [Oscillospiraceae bacterium]